jgi:hypothetical protein
MSPRFGGYSIGVFGWFGGNSFLCGLWLVWTLFAHLGSTFTVAFVLQSYQMKVWLVENEKRALDIWRQDSTTRMAEQGCKLAEVLELRRHIPSSVHVSQLGKLAQRRY